MTSRLSSPGVQQVVTLATQDERERLAMVIMQLEMALCLACSNGLEDVETHLEAALDEARHLYDNLLN
ncbi:hypothetical protein PZ897_03010 [Hoeflea sp. YIM 152468]|uniref:hypothetical protein n=1 Tax=Hoeflea sp. YIM 152468 TaxID=3031759 RepID=UPI0023DBABF7|nr:hypothetical protein [Hoeflea sp. YIM 152468]MDF1607138.1 hypothetical protein [Hoeflea sp. YIM 152468]